jgi:hypothetical protein
MNHYRILATAATALAVSCPTLAATSAKAEAVGGVTVTCPYSGPGFVACVAIGTVLQELVQFGNGKKGFGPNGELMKILSVPVRNLEIAKRESGFVAQVIAVPTGISIDAIKENGGVFGGGLSGGPGSFFRKNLGIRF